MDFLLRSWLIFVSVGEGGEEVGGEEVGVEVLDHQELGQAGGGEEEEDRTQHGH